MNLEISQRKKSLNFFLILLISFAIFNLGYIIDQTFRWTDAYEGFVNGIFHITVFGIGWFLYVLPWGLFVFIIYRWRKWKRYRSLLVLAPSIALLIYFVGSLVFWPETPNERFKRFTGVSLPASVSNLHWHFSGGGIADYDDTYYFTCKSEETDRLIKNMKLEKDPYFEKEGGYSPVNVLPNCPDYSTWDGLSQYRGGKDNGEWFYYLLTDSSKTKVYVVVGCI
jgi:hypothetical protein